jgi:protein arginine kinase
MADPDQRLKLRARLRPAFQGLASMPDANMLDLDAMDPNDLEVLKERHLISPELADQPKGSALIVGEAERIAVMVNEEDHLRLQAISPGMDLPEVWRRLDALDTELERSVEYTFSTDLGYLTACPTNVGTGLRASVMLHLPGLRLLEEVDPTIKGLNAIGFEVRGLLGEGTAAYGDMFQISNRATLGVTEDDILTRLTRTIEEVVEHERNARARLWEERGTRLRDHVGRAFGVVRYAHLMSSQEVLDVLSALRLGLEFELIGGVSETRLNEVMLVTQPGHLQKMAGAPLEPDDRDRLRAVTIRERLKDLAIRK